MFERGLELSQIEAVIASAREGRGALAIVEGPAGIGKTVLLAAARQVAIDAGVTVLSARGGPLERDFAFGIVRQLLGTIAQRTTSLDGPAGHALAALELLSERPRRGAPRATRGRIDPAGGEATAAIVHGIYWALATLAEHEPVLVLVDDAQWADGPSWRLIAYLARRLDDLALAVLLSSRPGADDDLDGSRLGEVVASPRAGVIALQPLSWAASAELVRDRLGAEAQDELCRACHVASAGNPFLLVELIAHLRQSGVEPTAANAARIATLRPASVARSVVANLARLGRDAGELARATAILGTGAELRWARLLAKLDPELAAVAADTLIGAELLVYESSLEFVHPLVRSTIYDSIPVAGRALMHARAARLLADDGADPDRVAAQLLLADPAGDPEVVTILRAAADRAERRGAPEVAARYLGRALGEPACDAESGAIRHALGRARIRAGDPLGLEELTAARNATIDPVERAEIALESGRAMMMFDRSAEALDLFAAARQELGSADAAVGALLDAEEVGGAMLDVSTAARATGPLLRCSPDLPGETLGERLLLAYRSYLAAARGDDPADVAAQARRALAAGDLAVEQTMAAFCFAASALTFADRAEEALAALDSAVAAARERGSTLTFALASWWRSHAHYRRGELAQAGADAQGALDATPDRWFTAPVGFLSDVLVERGELDAAEAAFIDYGLTTALFPNLLVANLLLDARGRLRCAQGRYAEGLADLLDVGDRQAAWEITNPAVIAWRSGAALALASLADDLRARELADEELALARRSGGRRALGVALRAAGLVHQGHAGLELLREAVSVLEHSEAKLERARALTDLGAALRRRGHRTEAREPLRIGLDLATACGGSALATRARQELVTAGARPRRARIGGAEALTASERRIATLAATGMTNREIAQTLFITIKTVKAHLGHVFQKLDISTRAQLTEALANSREQGT
jgi:DNA-binding CsgD family transcriptional regulator